MATPDPEPRGTACRRTNGRVDRRSIVGLLGHARRRPRPLNQQRVAGFQAHRVAARSVPLRVIARTIREPLITSLGPIFSPANSERGGMTTSAAPDSRDMMERSTSAAVRTASTVSAWSSA